MSIDNPQLADGYTPIANSIVDALARTRFSGYERSILDFLLRKTYGWAKKSDLISLSQFVDGTGILKPHVARTIKRLVERKVITRNGNDTLVRYELNKHYGEWIPLPKLVTLPKMVIQPLPKMVPTISIKDTKAKGLEDIVELPKIPYAEIISYLNQKAHTKYRSETEVNRNVINARWNDKWILADFIKVIDNMVNAWGRDAKMVNFLRPQTLFGSKFESYLNWQSDVHDGLYIKDGISRHCDATPASAFSDADDKIWGEK